MKKSAMYLFMTTAVFSLSAVGCGTSSSTSNDSSNGSKVTTITWDVFKDPTPAVTNLVSKFESENPNIKVKVNVMPAGSDAIHTALVTALGAQDDSIDVVSMDVVWPGEFGAANWVLPLNKYFTADKQKQFFKGPMDGVTYKNNVYAVPWYIDAGVLFYRADLVQTPPQTWDDLLKLAKEKQGANGTKYGFVFQGKQFEGLVDDYFELLWSNGGKVLDGNKVVINSPQGIQALQFMVDLVKKDQVVPAGVTTYDTEDSRRLFTEGQTVFLRNWPYVWANSQDPKSSKVVGKVGMAPIPKGPSGTAGASCLGGWTVGISQYSKHPEEAWKFINFLTSDEGEKINAIDGGRAPTLQSLFQDQDVLNKNPNFKPLYPVFQSATARPVTPHYSALSGVLQVHLHKALTGEETSKDALDQATAEITTILNK